MPPTTFDKRKAPSVDNDFIDVRIAALRSTDRANLACFSPMAGYRSIRSDPATLLIELDNISRL
jgi:hypothetical protein